MKKLTKVPYFLAGLLLWGMVVVSIASCKKRDFNSDTESTASVVRLPPIPSVVAQNDEWSCGPNSIARALRVYGYPDLYIQIQSKAVTMNPQVRAYKLGLSPREMTHILNSYQGIQARDMRGDLATIKQYIGNNRPVIVLLRVGTLSMDAPALHWAIVAGYDSAGRILIQDTNSSEYWVEENHFLNQFNWSTAAAYRTVLDAHNLKSRTMIIFTHSPLTGGGAGPLVPEQGQFIKSGLNGTMSCEDYCRSPAHGRVGECVNGVYAGTHQRVSCKQHWGLWRSRTPPSIDCLCREAIFKPGNNGSVTCDEFCQGDSWGSDIGKCVAAHFSSNAAKTNVGCSAQGQPLGCYCTSASWPKPGNNGTVSCNTYCEGHWGGRAGVCVAGQIAPEARQGWGIVGCDAVPQKPLTCHCTNTIARKEGNNGTISCDEYCENRPGVRSRCTSAITTSGKNVACSVNAAEPVACYCQK